MPQSQQEARRNLRRRFSKEEIQQILKRDKKVKNPRHTIEGARLTKADDDTRRKILKRILAPNREVDDRSSDVNQSIKDEKIADKLKAMLEKKGMKMPNPNKDLDKDPTIKTTKANETQEIKEMKNKSFGSDDYKTTNKTPGKKNKQYGDLLKKNLKDVDGNFSIGYNGNKVKGSSANLAMLIKQASDKKKEKDKKKKNLLAGGTAVGGGVLAKKSLPSLTGRKTLYHGTDNESLNKIMKDGIKGKFTGREGGNTRILKDQDPETFKKSLGKVFTTKSKGEAKNYAWQARHGGAQKAQQKVMQGDKDALLDKLKSLNPFSNKGVAKMKAPTWKMKTTKNPEARETFKKFKEKADPSGTIPDFQLKRIRKQMQDNVVFDQDVDSKYIKGSDDFKRLSFDEVKNYAKKNPKKFGLGVAGTAAGIGAAGYGIKKLIDNNKKKNKEDEGGEK
mgnify:CR=1 FL=1